MNFTISAVYLAVFWVTPGQAPDIRSAPMPQASIEECWKNAREFVAAGVPEKYREERGVIAAAATCFEKADPRT